MGLSVDAMRDTVRTAYPGDKWKAKVGNMPDNQVMAIYFRMVQEPAKRGRHSCASKNRKGTNYYGD